jgi:hypothetical protein
MVWLSSTSSIDIQMIVPMRATMVWGPTMSKISGAKQIAETPCFTRAVLWNGLASREWRKANYRNGGASAENQGTSLRDTNSYRDFDSDAAKILHLKHAK